MNLPEKSAETKSVPHSIDRAARVRHWVRRQTPIIVAAAKRLLMHSRRRSSGNTCPSIGLVLCPPAVSSAAWSRTPRPPACNWGRALPLAPPHFPESRVASPLRFLMRKGRLFEVVRRVRLSGIFRSVIRQANGLISCTNCRSVHCEE